MAIKMAYYPGNAARAASSEVEDCIQPLCKTLDIQLFELPRASSDGGNIIKQSSPKLQHALVARNLALAESKGLDILTSEDGLAAERRYWSVSYKHLTLPTKAYV